VTESAATRFSVQLYSATPGGPLNWRLLSGNNRECGRGTGGFATVEQCRALVTDLQHGLPRITRRNRRVDAYRWVWEMHLDGRHVAFAGHSFDRLVRCEQGARVFVDRFGAAAVRDGVVVSGARRWGTVA
jgi:hypothetical protein